MKIPLCCEGKNFEIGGFLHLKSEIRNWTGVQFEISNFGFEMGFCPISRSYCCPLLRGGEWRNPNALDVESPDARYFARDGCGGCRTDGSIEPGRGGRSSTDARRGGSSLSRRSGLRDL